MQALTISQPYASLIASGAKWIENRSWPTRYRGPLAIHAGKGSQYLNKSELAEYPTGCIVSVALLVGCVPYETIRDKAKGPDRHLEVGPLIGRSFLEAYEHPHCEGPYCWFITEVVQVEPIPVRGALGFWKIPESCKVALVDQLKDVSSFEIGAK